ncbi:LamG-like jellyroll fold domain-containing protein [Actinoplanes subtropicus]|uniref:LamG-like jellyroll fold domain-containing protein n=1 Tax=Actinoplanes subtropicus TaxID=543632 RepID=UPI000A070B89|nr:LamG-like jellyroll fold domain-containing protein [Actinoplanes subtropicus]
MHDHGDSCLQHALSSSANCADLHEHGDTTPRASRRGLLRAAGLLGAGAMATAALPAAAAEANPRGTFQNDCDSPRFTLVVIPDTQYLFDEDRGDSRPLEASLRWILDHAEDENIVFLSHLGDLTQNGLASEFASIGKAFERLDRAGAAYSVLAGNHDIDSGTDDSRGDSPYLQTFGPKRFRGARSGVTSGASPDGYNSYHLFTAGGRQWLVLALDWRPSAAGIAWAQSVLDQHPALPVILTTHEIAFADDDGEAHLSDFGRQLWDQFIARNDRVFLTLNGHFWPPGRTVLKNDAGHDVHVHITNYQDRYYGGGAMIRLYRFDLARGCVDVETISPYFLGMAAEKRDELAELEVQLTGPTNRFSIDIDFATRFGAAPARPARPAKAVLVPGTLAYWRFDQATGGAVGGVIPDLSGNRNDLTRVELSGGPDTLTWSDDHHPDQPAHASLRFRGGKKPARGAYLRTADGAPLNALTLDRGYTIETFVKLPADFGDAHAWCGVLTRMGTGGDAGKTGDDPSEPAGCLNLSSVAELQWAVFPRNQNRMSTNWSHLLPLGKWWHVAVVNDGKHTIMYVDGCPVVRNPSTPAIGLATAGKPWLVGAYHYADIVEQAYYGWLGDVRIVGRALRPDQFLKA